MIWLFIYVVGTALMFIISMFQITRRGFFEHLIVGLLWPLILIANFCYRIYKKIKKLWQY